MTQKKLYTSEEARAHIQSFIKEQRVILENDLIKIRNNSNKVELYEKI